MAFPDVLGALIEYLTDEFPAVKVASRIPPNEVPRPPLIQVRRVGGAAELPVRETPRLDVWVWHNTDVEAMTLALAVRERLWALAGTNVLGFPLYRLEEFLGPRQDDDPLTGLPRVWATYAPTVRADNAVTPQPVETS